MVGFHIGGCDYMGGGATVDDAVNACRIREKEGLGCLSLTGGMCRYTRRGLNSPRVISVTFTKLSERKSPFPFCSRVA